VETKRILSTERPGQLGRREAAVVAEGGGQKREVEEEASYCQQGAAEPHVQDVEFCLCLLLLGPEVLLRLVVSLLVQPQVVQSYYRIQSSASKNQVDLWKIDPSYFRLK